jgi:hypothetical protein
MVAIPTADFWCFTLERVNGLLSGRATCTCRRLLFQLMRPAPGMLYSGNPTLLSTRRREGRCDGHTRRRSAVLCDRVTACYKIGRGKMLACAPELARAIELFVNT